MILMRRDFLLSGTLAAAAMTSIGPLMAQSTGPVAPAVPAPPADAPYEAPKEVRALKITNLFDLETMAEKILPAGGFGYISAGSGVNWTRYENMVAFDRIHIEPQSLSGHANVDLTVDIFGSPLKMPIIVPPMTGHGLAHVSMEEGTAKATDAVGTLMIASTRSDLSMEAIAAATPGPKWFQLDFPRDLGYARELLQRAKSAGYKAIVPTIDNVFEFPRDDAAFQPPAWFGKGNRSRSAADPAQADRMLNDRKRDLNWDDMEFVKRESGLPVIIKGVLSPRVAATAIRRGMDAIYVSNHGGRAFDGVNATISALPRIADTVQDSIPIIFDGGIRRSADVFKAIALGAKVVACGRPVLYGLALGGALGAQSVLEHLRDHLTIVMQLSGTRTVQDIKPENLAPTE